MLGRYVAPDRSGRKFTDLDGIVPDIVTREAVVAIGERVADLAARGAPLSELIDVSPLVDDQAAWGTLRQQPLEAAIEEHLPYLRAVCFRPAARLRSTNRLVPVARMRTVTPPSIVRLAAHSEDWAALRPDGVRPDRMLSPEREVEVDLYENRLAARLVDESSRYLAGRAAQIRGIESMFSGIEHYIDDIAGRHWKSGLRLWSLVGELFDREDWQELARLRLAEVELLRTAVMALRSSPVWAGVNRRAALGSALRSTNLLASEDRYRHVAELWRELVTSRGADQSANALMKQAERWVAGFDGFCWVLVVRAFDELGAVAVTPVRVGEPVTYSIGGTTMTLRPSTGSGVLLLEQDSAPVMRIVALPHALSASGNADTVSTQLDALIAAAPELPTLVLYPGTQEERQKLPEAVRLRTYESPGTPAPQHRDLMLWPMPVSPLEIDSVIRLARTVRWLVEQPRLTSYPHTVPCGAALAAELAAKWDWLVRVPAGVAVIRIPAPHERAAAETFVWANRHETARFRGRGSNVAEMETLWQGIERAVADTLDLTRCPRCGSSPARPERALEPRGGSGFRATCGDCDAAWESRSCASCRRTYPVLVTAGPMIEFPDGDRIDRRYGIDLLAAPCATRDRIFICPWCTSCGNETASPNCVRCTATV
ncbi:hypothetical protein Ade02nite_95800 [Paractinoplanes deccanensis]|uniref:DUF2357 domain-containing protein n=1 Tax=Paractinoplanes deccanensis TaxID=113561 RepID=A0ABQ3YLR7_9ACTN|nr:hypothetical protein [Actinoplanes deccanensis]GID80939.1 hypothetical protein Ade02nite_95800 [Actinoplanes deccanensis]